MRLRGRTDANQAALVEQLRQLGWSVLVISCMGKGVPDLCVGVPRGNIFFEVKDGSKPESARKLTPDEKRWLESWRGPRAVVCTLADCIEAMRIWGLLPGLDGSISSRYTVPHDTRCSVSRGSPAGAQGEDSTGPGRGTA